MPTIQQRNSSLQFLRAPQEKTSRTSSQDSLGYSSSNSDRSESSSPPPSSLPLSKYHDLFLDSVTTAQDHREEASKRIKQNSKHILRSQDAVKDTLEKSYLFESGLQAKDEHYANLFTDYFAEMHGGKKLVQSCSSRLARDCANYKDVSRVEVRTIDGGDYDDTVITSYYPTSQLVEELNAVLASRYGLQEELLITLQDHNKCFARAAGGEGIELKARDHWLSTLSKQNPYKRNILLHIPIAAIARLFPKCLEALHKIFQELLIAEWLKQDIEGIKQYLNETAGPEKSIAKATQAELEQAIALWVIAKHKGAEREKHDEAISKRNWNNFKDDV